MNDIPIAPGLAPARLDDLLVSVETDDERLWVSPEHEPGVRWRPIMIDLASGNRVEALRMTRGARLTRHLHPCPVHGYVIHGRWRYLEHDWIAEPGTYVYEPPGDNHTLVNDLSDEMLTLFFLFGPMIYVDDQDRAVGHDDNVSIMTKAADHYETVGLGRDYINRFLR